MLALAGPGRAGGEGPQRYVFAILRAEWRRRSRQTHTHTTSGFTSGFGPSRTRGDIQAETKICPFSCGVGFEV